MPVEDLYARACEAIERANYDYAIELIREVLRQNPQFPEARVALRGTERRRAQERGRSIGALLALPFRMASTALRAAFGGARKALEAYEDFLETYPDSFWGLTGAAAAAHKAGLPGEAAQVFKDALRFKPNSKRLLRALADALKDADEPEEALKYVLRLSSMNPTDRDLLAEVRDLEATDHMVSHQMDSATSFRDMVRDKEQAEKLEAAQRMTVSADDLRRQVTEAEQALRADPRHPTKTLRLAQLYLDTDQLGKARSLLLKMNKELPDNYQIREKLGDVQLMVYDRAIRQLAEQLEKEPGNSEARAKKEQLEGKRNRFAIKEYQWRIEQHPTDRTLQFKLGLAYFRAGRHNEAIASFQEAAHEPRHQLESARMLGLCFMHKRQFDLALEQFSRAIKRHPDMDEEGKELRYLQASAYEQMGRTEEALNIYKQIYSQDINFKDVAAKVDSLTGAGTGRPRNSRQ